MTNQPKQTRRFSHIRLANWRNFLHVDVALQRRMFLFGPNASGKSNFLDAFRFLKDIVSVGGGFQEAVSQRGGVSKLRCLAARRNPDLAITIRVCDRDDNPVWEYEIGFTKEKNAPPIITKEKIIKNGKDTILSRPNKDDIKDPEQLGQTYLEQVRVNREFRNLASFFGSVDYLHIVPQLVRAPDRYRGKQHDPFGWDFLERVSSVQERTRNARLKRVRDALRIAVPQLRDFELIRDDRGIPHLRGRYEHWRPKGAWQTEEMFSDGTLRLLGLLWATLDGSGPLLLEEPEMQLHPDVVRLIPQMLARMQRRTGRQVIISSHSADLLRDEGLGLDEVIFLEPSSEGTNVRLADSIDEIKAILQGGGSLAEAIIPRTRPKGVEQLPLFADR